MSLRAVCPGCRSAFHFDDAIRGRKVRCAKCKQTFIAGAEAPEPREEEEEDGARANEPEENQDDVPEPSPRLKARAARKKKPFPLLAVGLVSFLVVGACAGLFTFLYFTVFLERVEKPVTDADREIVVTAEQVAAKVPGLKLRPGLEEFHKFRLRSGNYEISYRYGTPEDIKNSFFLESVAIIAPREEDAMSAFIHYSGELNLGPAWEGPNKLRRVEGRNLLRLGEECQCELLMSGTTTFVGNAFTARRGKRVIRFVLLGQAFHDGNALRDLLTPQFQRLDGYKP